MATEKLATYKRYNGTDWDTIYFKTKWSQIVQDASNGFFMTSGHTINGKSWTGSNKTITLAGADINYTGETGTYVTNGTTLDANLKALDAAVLAAKNAIPSGVLTSSNYAETLGSVYQPLNDELTNLTSLSSATETGLVFRVAGSTSLNRYSTVTYQSLASSLSGSSAGSNKLAKQSTTVNGKPLSANITLTGGDIAVSSSDSTKISDKLTSIAELAEGKTSTYVINTSYNEDFNVAKTNSSKTVLYFAVMRTSNTNTDGVTDIFRNETKFTAMNSGDIVLTVDKDVKDWFYAGVTYYATGSAANGDYSDLPSSITSLTSPFYLHVFYNIEADTPSLTNYATRSYVDTAISNLDFASVGGSEYYIQSISETDGKISATAASMPTSLPASNTSNTYSSTGTVPVSGTAVNAALGTSITGASMASYGVTLKTGGTFKAPTVTVTATSDSTPSASNTNIMNGKSVYSYVSARATKIFYADTVPTSGMITGDICIEY